MGKFCFAVPLSLSLLTMASCSKAAKSDQAEGTAAPEATASDEANSDKADLARADLEQAIADQGPKKITAMGGSGKSEVVDLDQTTLAETETYLVKANVPDNASAGGDSAVTINLIPKTGWKINQEFPTRLHVTAPEGVVLTADSQGAKDAASFGEKEASFLVPFSSSSAGSKDFAAKFRFAVCTDTTCDPKSADLAWTVQVK